eukprot:gene656-831_t
MIAGKFKQGLSVGRLTIEGANDSNILPSRDKEQPMDIRRIVTGHDAAGRAIIRSDELLPVTPIPSGDAAFSLVWTTATVPADNNDETDGRTREAGLTTIPCAVGA